MTTRFGQVQTNYLQDAGNSPLLAVDGSVTPVLFSHKFVARKTRLYRFGISLETTGATAPAPNLFGNLAALTNGILLQLVDSAGTVTDLTGGVPIRKNQDLARFLGAGLKYDVGVGNDAVFGDVVMVDVFGEPLLARATEEVQILVQDDLTGLTDAWASVQSVVEA